MQTFAQCVFINNNRHPTKLGSPSMFDRSNVCLNSGAWIYRKESMEKKKEKKSHPEWNFKERLFVCLGFFLTMWWSDGSNSNISNCGLATVDIDVFVFVCFVFSVCGCGVWVCVCVCVCFPFLFSAEMFKWRIECNESQI